jgi:hypothetical protein
MDSPQNSKKSEFRVTFTETKNMMNSIYGDASDCSDLVLTNLHLHRGRPTKTMPSSSSVSFSLRRILPSEVTSECGVTGLSSATSRSRDAVESAVEGTGVDSFGVGDVSTVTSFVVCDKVKTSEGVSGAGGAFGSEISRNVSSICL